MRQESWHWPIVVVCLVPETGTGNGESHTSKKIFTAQMIDLTLPGPAWLYTLEAGSRVGAEGSSSGRSVWLSSTGKSSSFSQWCRFSAAQWSWLGLVSFSSLHNKSSLPLLDLLGGGGRKRGLSSCIVYLGGLQGCIPWVAARSSLRQNARWFQEGPTAGQSWVHQCQW